MKICIIGAGRVAWSLIPALQHAGAEVHQLITRNAARRELFAETYSIPVLSENASALEADIDLIILTLPDNSIAPFTETLPSSGSGAILVHTSGSISIEALSAWQGPTGVFYPMQTFTLQKKKDYKEVPIFLEGSPAVLKKLKPLAQSMSRRVQVLDSPARAKLHLGAVMVCNFTNLLYTYADELIPEVDINAYEPLIRGHLENVFSIGPQASQTGPAARGDHEVITRHLEMLKAKPEVAELYKMMSEAIIQIKELRN